MPIIEVKNLTKKFKNFVAVDDVSFELEEGEILGLLGPNGAGKTTTIQMLLGVLNPTAGEVKYFGKPFSENRREILEQVNFSSTYTNLPYELTVRENLIFISHLYAIKNRKGRVAEIIKLFHLEEIAKKQVEDLSAGQMTRVNLAKAFINFPKVLLLDEPTASLDPDVAQYIREFLLSERKQFKVSIILTSHNMAEVEEVCDRVVFINHGKVIANDTPENLAKSLCITHVKILVADGLKRLEAICRERGLKFQEKGRYAYLDIHEEKVSEFLEEIKKAGIVYSEISISEPTLEDYFLEVSRTAKT